MKIKNKNILIRTTHTAYFKVGMYERDYLFLSGIRDKYDRDLRSILISIFEHCIKRGAHNFSKACDDQIIPKSFNLPAVIKDELRSAATFLKLTNPVLSARLLRKFIQTKDKNKLEEIIGSCQDIMKKLKLTGT